MALILGNPVTAVSVMANPYAAMPSLHAADSLIVGICMALACRRLWAKALWLAWPLWVSFIVIATANHFWLDCAIGICLALLIAPVIDSRFRFWRRGTTRTAPAIEPLALATAIADPQARVAG